MRKIVFLSLVGGVLLQAQVLPGINSKGGAMTLPEGKFKMGLKQTWEMIQAQFFAQNYHLKHLVEQLDISLLRLSLFHLKNQKYM